MIAPHELKNKEFSKSLRGYSTVEVDEHIAFIIEKYTELYRLNDELEKKLRLTEAQLDAIKAEEESIRATLVNAQKASTRIIAEANERADVIMRSAKNGCDRIIAELMANVKVENERLRQAKQEVAAFKAALFEGYQSHIEQIEKIAPDVEIKPYDEMEAEELSKEVLNRIRQDLSGKKPIISGTEDPFFEEEEDPTEDEPVAEDEENIAPAASAEVPIPDVIDDLFDVSPDAEAFTAARDSEESFIGDNEDDELPVERQEIKESGSILNSIKQLNETADSMGDDDEEFLRMLKKVSAEHDRTDMSSTDEFEMVYDGKKLK